MSHITTLPTAEQVRIESKLRPEQVDITLGSVNALEAYIDDLITEQASVVESCLTSSALPLTWPFTDDQVVTAFPAYGDDEVEETIARQQSNATLVVKYFTLSALYLSAGQLQESFLERSREYKTRGNELLKTLKAELAHIGTHQLSGVTTYATTLTTGRGDYTPVIDDDLGWYPA
jgi:hypothetical protein